MRKKIGIYYLAFQNVRRRVFRGIVLASAICLLVSMLIFALSFVSTVSESLEKTTNRLGADLIIVPAGAKTGAEQFLLNSEINTFYMDRGYFETIQSRNEVESATYQIYLKTISGVCCGIFDAQIIAIDQKTDFVVKPWLKEEIELKEGEIFVGASSADDLERGLYETALLFEEEYKIVGTLEKTGTGLDTSVFMREEDMEKIINEKQRVDPGQISSIFVKLRRGYEPSIVARVIENAHFELGVIPRGEIGSSINETLLDISKIFSLSIFLSAVLSIFLAWAVFSAIVNERRREVGIMIAIGARRMHVIKQFLFEAILIGGTGSVGGVIIGNIITFYLIGEFALLANISSDVNVANIAIISVSGFLIGTLICVLGALMPIIRISGMEPLSTMREE
jgi:putative ABC transport system permease protein